MLSGVSNLSGFFICCCCCRPPILPGPSLLHAANIINSHKRHVFEWHLDVFIYFSTLIHIDKCIYRWAIGFSFCHPQTVPHHHHTFHSHPSISPLANPHRPDDIGSLSGKRSHSLVLTSHFIFILFFVFLLASIPGHEHGPRPRLLPKNQKRKQFTEYYMDGNAGAMCTSHFVYINLFQFYDLMQKFQ